MNKMLKPFRGFIVLVLIFTLLGPVAAMAGAYSARLQPLLAQVAEDQPFQQVSVIVQKADETSVAEQLAIKLGGVITKDLSLINAFAAEMTAGGARQLAASPAVRWVSLDAPVSTSGANFTAWATKTGVVTPNSFTNQQNILSPIGINKTYGFGSNVKGAFGGFQAEYTPGQGIINVYVKLRLYVSTKLGSAEKILVTPYVNGQPGASVSIGSGTLNSLVGATKVSTLSLNITTGRTWIWEDFRTLEILIDQSQIASTHSIYYDAVGVQVVSNGSKTDTSSPLVYSSVDDTAAVNSNVLTNVFQRTTRAVDIWNEAPYWQGSGVTVAVVDSGSFRTNAIGSRFIGEVNFNSTEHNANDTYGHGTFVAGVIADDGSSSGGIYMGIAPKVNILGVRVSDDAGMSSESDVVNALQWVYNNRAAYNIRVANLSLNSSVWQSYHTSPLCAAVEILWFNGVTVVASAGNNGSATLFPPANDPFVITVGATNDMATAAMTDDVMASFSAYGTDEAGRAKPDLVAPGTNIIAYLPDTNQLSISVQHPGNRVDSNYFRMSGTSMSAPMVSGAAAIVLQANPNLTPDQVKYRLMATAKKSWAGYNSGMAGAGYLDVYAAVKGTTTQSANTGLTASQLLWTGSEPVTWGSVAWNSVAWNSVAWNSVAWNSVAWNSVAWNSDYWGP